MKKKAGIVSFQVQNFDVNIFHFSSISHFSQQSSTTRKS